MVRTQQNGFTLVELMIVVAIVAILVAIAYPSYQQHVKKTKRNEAKAEMIQISAKLQRYKIANFTFMKAGTPPTAITLADINQATTLPKVGAALYDLALTDVTAGAWTLTATPKAGLMANNGIITLDSQGRKCWSPGAATCTLTDTSSWDEK